MTCLMGFINASYEVREGERRRKDDGAVREFPIYFIEAEPTSAEYHAARQVRFPGAR
jgi:hypothetical protein